MGILHEANHNALTKGANSLLCNSRYSGKSAVKKAQWKKRSSKGAVVTKR